jgi:hypothetical protein
VLVTNGCHRREGTAVAAHTGPLVVRNLAVGHSLVAGRSLGFGLRSPAAVRVLAAGVLE